MKPSLDLKELLFPHDDVRNIQDDMIHTVQEALSEKKDVVVHAPTGIGKTVSALAPALSFAIKNKKKVFFLTSRQTQHAIAIDTLKQIRKKHDVHFSVVDLIGKKWMCAQDVAALTSNDFLDYCKKARDKDQCEFYLNTRKKSQRPTVSAENTVSELKVLGPLHVHELIDECKKPRLCPYEMSSFLAKDATCIIADYNMVFHPNVRDSLFSRSDIKLSECIVVVDEGHNLPSRCRELLTAKLSGFILDRAIKEANKFEFYGLLSKLKHLKDVLEMLGKDLHFNKEERLLRKYEFIQEIEEYDETIEECKHISDDIREKQKQSYVGSVGEFLEAWQGQDSGFARILSKNEDGEITLNYRCLDPSLITKDVIDSAYATILMSGTLLPTHMYTDLIGFSNSVEKVFDNPFPKENRLSMIVPETTTKFSRRSESEFKRIAEICHTICESVPGNVALFFPSYYLRDQVYRYFYDTSSKKKFLEKPQMGKMEREALISDFKAESKNGGVLLGVSAGSFGEGVDLPGDLLKGVVVIGLPLDKPDLETKELIDYYDDKYGKGLDYGYVFPAFTKCLQNAGRCIRSENDKGIVVFLDERFSWQNYIRCFPDNMDIKISKLYENRIKEFFGIATDSKTEEVSETSGDKEDLESLGGFVSGDKL